MLGLSRFAGQFPRIAIEAGTKAGNVCTHNAPRTDVAGVDCSAFVSAAWGLSTHYTTAAIPAIAKRLDNPWDLQPGDALNKPGSHVMLFLRFTPDRKAEVMEASTGGCNGRVCRNVYPLASLLARGYVPVRFRALADGQIGGLGECLSGQGSPTASQKPGAKREIRGTARQAQCRDAHRREFAVQPDDRQFDDDGTMVDVADARSILQI